MNFHLHRALLLIAGLCFACSAAPASAENPPAKETVSIFGEKELPVPASWKRTRPQSSIVEHEFVIKADDAAEAPSARITLMAAGGDVKANIDRWKAQFTGGAAAAQKSEEKKVGEWTVHMVDLSGNFKETMGGGPFAGGKVVERQNYAMVGSILVDPKGRKYFIKMTGPANLVQANRDSVVDMVDGLK